MNAKLYYYYLVWGLLFVFFFGCTSIIPITPTAVFTLSITTNTTSVITSVPTPSPNVSAVSTATPQLQFFYPKTEKLCPENREVPIHMLGINNDLKIILSHPEQPSLWFLDEDKTIPELIEKLPAGYWTSSSISPDEKRLAYTTWSSDHSSSIRIYDLEKKAEYEALNIKYWDGLAPYVVWLSNQELLVVNACHTTGCHFPLRIINTNTGEITAVDETNSEPYDTYLGFFKNANRYYALYSSTKNDSYSEFYVYDYSNERKVQVFPWLKDKVFFYPTVGTNLGIITSEKKIALVVEQSYGFDIGIVENVMEGWTQAISYHNLMKRIPTDIPFYELGLSFHGINPSNRNLLLSMNYKDYINSTDRPQNVENAFFTLDLMHPVVAQRESYLVFTNYCFTTTGYLFKGTSPDGQIVTFASDEEIIFLNLETGYMARLLNWRFIGWAK